MNPDTVPEGRCGFTLAPGDTPAEVDLDVDNIERWYELTRSVCCWRESWEESDNGQCIWHADVDKKSSSELPLSTVGKRVDGAILRGINAGGITLQPGTVLFGADLSGADLHHANLREVDFRSSAFMDANLAHSDLVDAIFADSDFTNATLNNANITNANLRRAILTDAVLMNANLTNADLWAANLTDSDLRSVDFSGADFWGANLSHADLRIATLTNAYFGEADLTGTAITYTAFGEFEIDEGTKFGGRSYGEAFADEAAARQIPILPWPVKLLRCFGRPSTSLHELKQAELQYRATQRALRENDLQQLPELAVREKHIRRKRALAEQDYWTWLKLAFYRWPLGYGERVRNVIATSIVAIVGFALIYPFFGGMESTSEETTRYAFTNWGEIPGLVPNWVEILGANLYFSAVTFTTLGYGDIQPATPATQALASLESLLGALLIAFLVFVLGRRTAW